MNNTLQHFFRGLAVLGIIIVSICVLSAIIQNPESVMSFLTSLPN